MNSPEEPFSFPPTKEKTYEESYQEFVESMVPYCQCEEDRPCDGVLAGGICDCRRLDPLASIFDEDEEES